MRHTKRNLFLHKKSSYKLIRNRALAFHSLTKLKPPVEPYRPTPRMGAAPRAANSRTYSPWVLLQLKMGWTSPSTSGSLPVPACPHRKYNSVTRSGRQPGPLLRRRHIHCYTLKTYLRKDRSPPRGFTQRNQLQRRLSRPRVDFTPK